MNKILRRAKQFSEQAARVREAIAGAPEKVQQIQEAVLATTSQLQQLRSDVQSTVTGLRADNESLVFQSLRELDESAGVLREAGFELDTVEMEFGLGQRLVVHLERVEEVPEPLLRLLLNANMGRRTVHAILSALLKASEMAGHVRLSNLHYDKLTVYVGPTPSIRICWRPEMEETPVPPAAPPPVPSAAVSAPASSMFGQGSFFERRSPAAAPVTQPQITPPIRESSAAPRVQPVAKSSPAPAEETDAQRDPLARFKKMPDLSKPRR